MKGYELNDREAGITTHGVETIVGASMVAVPFQVAINLGVLCISVKEFRNFC